MNSNTQILEIYSLAQLSSKQLLLKDMSRHISQLAEGYDMKYLLIIIAYLLQDMTWHIF